MNVQERDAFLLTERTARVATIGGRGRPHVMPLWFVWLEEALWFSSILRSSRWEHLQDRPEIAAVVDAGDAYDELRGVELRGRAEIVGEVPRGTAADPVLDAVEGRFAAKYRGGEPFVPDGKHAWVRLAPRSIVSWDFRKLPSAPVRRA